MIIATIAIISTTGTTWSEYTIRLTTYGDFDGIPSITQTSDGKIWIVWMTKTGSSYTVVCKTSIDAGTSWSNEAILAPGPDMDIDPSIFQAMDNTIWVVWSSSRTGGYDLYYKTSSDNGVSWSSDTRLTTDQAEEFNPAITQTANGTVWVVWSSSRTGGYDLYYKTSSDNGVSWSSDTRLTTDPNLDKLPSIAQTGDGKIWVVWCSDRLAGNYELFYKIYNGSSWSNDAQLTANPRIEMDPMILQTFDGEIYIFWSSRSHGETGQDDLYYITSSDNGSTWSNNIQFTTDNNDDMWPSVTQTGDWKIWVVWTSNRGDQPDGNWDIYYLTSLTCPRLLWPTLLSWAIRIMIGTQTLRRMASLTCETSP